MIQIHIHPLNIHRGDLGVHKNVARKILAPKLPENMQ